MQSAFSAHEIKIPLGLSWGDPVEKLESLARPGGFSITQREETAGKTIITVHGLLGVALQENLFIFQKNALIEIEYRYGNKAWSAHQYQNFFDSFRRMYDLKYGAALALSPATAKKTNDVTLSLVGYRWSDPFSALELFYYSAEQPEGKAYRLVSLHYKAL